MAIRIYGENLSSDSFFRLIQLTERGDISLVEVDKNGAILPCGYMLNITPDGIALCRGYRGSIPSNDDRNVKVIVQ